MRTSGASPLLGLVLGLTAIHPATAQGPTPAAQGATSPIVAAQPDFARLKGTWVRLDGGYTIVIKSIGPGGQLEAMYFNPNPLPFAKAQTTRVGATFRAFFELRAGGYGGSTYELTYDSASDRLNGVYYQAVAKQKFDVSFARK
jgi:hypothetical protein